MLAGVNKSLADILKDAVDNLNMVAEANARLAANGQTSLATWQKQAEAIKYLTDQRDKLSKKEKDAAKETSKFLDAIQGVQKSALVASVTLTGVYTELRHFAAAANPGVFDAMSGATQILSARLGRALLPAMTDAINVVMDAADWFEQLSDTEQNLVAGAAVAVPALIGLASAAHALAPAIRGAGVALAWLWKQAKAHPTAAMGGGAVGLAAGTVIGAYAFHQMVQADNEKHYQSVREQGGRSGPATAAEIRQARGESRRIGYGDSVNDEQFERMGDEERRRYFQQRAAYLHQRAAALRSHFFHTEGEANQREAAALIFERAARSGATTVGEEDWRKRARRQAMLASAVQREQQPRYSPLAAARKQLQLQILGKNPFEQQLLKEQRKARQDVVRKLDEILKEGRQRGYRLFET